MPVPSYMPRRSIYAALLALPFHIGGNEGALAQTAGGGLDSVDSVVNALPDEALRDCIAAFDEQYRPNPASTIIGGGNRAHIGNIDCARRDGFKLFTRSGQQIQDEHQCEFTIGKTDFGKSASFPRLDQAVLLTVSYDTIAISQRGGSLWTSFGTANRSGASDSFLYNGGEVIYFIDRKNIPARWPSHVMSLRPSVPMRRGAPGEVAPDYKGPDLPGFDSMTGRIRAALSACAALVS